MSISPQEIMNDYRQITSKKLSKSGEMKIVNSYNKNINKSTKKELNNSNKIIHEKSKEFLYYKNFVIYFFILNRLRCTFFHFRKI